MCFTGSGTTDPLFYLDGNGTATYVGHHPKVKGTELFKIEF